MKMLTTQISGLLQRILTSQEEEVEDTARLLAQAAVGEGKIVIAGMHEMQGIVFNALSGAEPLIQAIAYSDGMEIGLTDRVWLFSRDSTDDDTLKLARSLHKQGVPFAAVSNTKNSTDNELSNLADVYIATGITKGLLPDDEGNRIVQPHLLAALIIYEAVKLSFDEFLIDS